MRLATCLVLACFVSTAPAAYGQSTNASVSGRVTDPSGAVVVGADIAAIRMEINLRCATTTNGVGEYVLSNLAPGVYRIEVEKPGFRKILKPDVIVHVQDALAIDFELSVGTVSEAVTVEAGARLVNAQSATVSTVVDRGFVSNLPLNGRSFQTLLMLTPGVVVAQTAYNDQGQFNVNGQRADANYFTVDGISANFGVTGFFPLGQTAGGALPAMSASGGTNSLVSVDAMQEFRVQTSTFSPEFGRTPGGQVSIVTRSGTNQFHGTAFEYLRHSALDANSWFANRDNLPKPDQRQNDFGGVLGGPILTNKTFFFASYEGLRLHQPATQETIVPDVASRHAAPASMQPFLNAYPIPNGPAVGTGLARFDGSYSNPSTLDTFSVRLDHIANPKMNLFGRYNYSPSNSDTRSPYSALSTGESLSSSVQTVTVGLTQLIKGSLSNEVRGNYSYQRVSTAFWLDDFGGAQPLADQTLFPSGSSSADSVFELLILGAGELAKGRFGDDDQHQLNVIDNLSAVFGAHQLKFGIDYRRQSPSSNPFSYLQFAGFSGVDRGPGGALSGTALYANVASHEGSTFLTQNLSLYGQDTWRVSGRLSATYGLRWDINTPLEGKNLANQPFAVTGLNNPSTMALEPRGTPLYKTVYGNVAPRLGVVYELRQSTNWNTVLRGGYGMFYDLGYGSAGTASAFFPFNTVRTVSPSVCPSGASGVCFPLSAEQAAPPTPTTDPPVPSINVVDPHLKTPRTYQWNVAVDQAIGPMQTVSVTYVGAAGRDLLRTVALFNPNPDFQLVQAMSNTAESNYKALQVKLQRRLSEGLQVLASYTLSHSTDTASSDAATYISAPSVNGNTNADHGDSDFDIRHSLTIGATYQLPNATWSKVSEAALGGWSVDAFVLARSAPPVNVIAGLDLAGGTALYPRPNVVPGLPLELYGSQYPGGKVFNRAAFVAPPPGTQGDFGRNVLRGFDAVQVDTSLRRDFHLTKELRLQFRVEAFNVFNRANFGSPNNNLTSPLFGYSTQTLATSLGAGGANGGFSPLYQVGGPRSIQLALKLIY